MLGRTPIVVRLASRVFEMRWLHPILTAAHSPLCARSFVRGPRPSALTLFFTDAFFIRYPRGVIAPIFPLRPFPAPLQPYDTTTLVGALV